MKTILAAVNAKYIHSNLAVYSLRAYAKDYLSETKIAEYTINQQIDEILMDLYREQPELLCFSCYIWNLDYVEELVREIKRSCRRRSSGLAVRKSPTMRKRCFSDCRRLPE